MTVRSVTRAQEPSIRGALILLRRDNNEVPALGASLPESLDPQDAGIGLHGYEVFLVLGLPFELKVTPVIRSVVSVRQREEQAWLLFTALVLDAERDADSEAL